MLYLRKVRRKKVQFDILDLRVFCKNEFFFLHIYVLLFIFFKEIYFMQKVFDIRREIWF